MTAINIRPGDVVLFSGRTPIHQLVQRLTKGSWTQVGLVLSLPNCNELLLMEATSIAYLDLSRVWTQPARQRADGPAYLNQEGALRRLDARDPIKICVDARRRRKVYGPPVVGAPENFADWLTRIRGSHPSPTTPRPGSVRGPARPEHSTDRRAGAREENASPLLAQWRITSTTRGGAVAK